MSQSDGGQGQSQGATPAGWYPDPWDQTSLRYWDGLEWTGHIAPSEPVAAEVPPVLVVPIQAPVPTPLVPPAFVPPAPPTQWAQTPPVSPNRKFGFGESIKRGFAKWSDYSGRATLGEYWWFALFTFLVLLVPSLLFIFAVVPPSMQTAMLDPAASTDDPFAGSDFQVTPLLVVFVIAWLILLLVMFFTTLSLAVRRLHDSDRSGWWYLLNWVPIGSLVVFIFTLLPGTPGANRFGAPSS